MEILITEDLDAPAIARLAGRFEVVREPLLWKDPVALKAGIAGARAVMVRNQTRLTAEVLAGAHALRVIGRVGVGLDNIDVAAATKLGIVVVAPLDANAVSVAELTLGLLLALARKIPASDRATRTGAWDRKAGTGAELQGKTLAIVGFGRIGRLVAARARAFGMRLVMFDPFLAPDAPVLADLGAERCPRLEAALGGADFISVHLPLTDRTRRLFDARAFAAAKPGAYFINTARGGVVDEAALLAALRSGHLAGAALDVRESEPPDGPGAFEALPNVILTPHVGAFTVEAQARTFEAVASDIERVLDGQPAENSLNLTTPARA